MIYQKYAKRILDITLSGAAIIVLSPVMGVTAILVKKKLGSPVIFKQKRPGKDEKIFTMYKFRTMTDERDENGEMLPDGVRLTKFGNLLGCTCLYELPEFLIIINGFLSNMGPRPLLVQYLPLYNEKQKRRHEVRPGLSGLAQVNGRNAITWDEKFNYDVEYVEKVSFALDVRIVLRTIIKAFRQEDINAGSEMTMEAFTGEPS